jgi:hypothetical protein
MAIIASAQALFVEAHKYAVVLRNRSIDGFPQACVAARHYLQSVVG